MSQRDRDRLAVLRQVRDGLVTARRGAELVGLTPRHFRRLRRRWEAKGDRAVIHGLRGQRSNRALPTELRERVMVRVREPVFSDFAPTLLAEHPSTDPEIGELNAYTLRRWMIEEELWKPLGPGSGMSALQAAMGRGSSLSDRRDRIGNSTPDPAEEERVTLELARILLDRS